MRPPMYPKLVIQITGSRDWRDQSRISAALKDTMVRHDALPDETLVIHGDARGADRLAAQAARYLGCQIEAYPADWSLPGKSAGHIRNQQMLNRTLSFDCPIEVLAFKANFGAVPGKGGTEHMVKICKKAGLRGRIIRS